MGIKPAMGNDPDNSYKTQCSATERTGVGQVGCYHLPALVCVPGVNLVLPGKVSNCPSFRSAWWARSNGLQLLWWLAVRVASRGTRETDLTTETPTGNNPVSIRKRYSRHGAAGQYMQFGGTICSCPPKSLKQLLAESFARGLDVKCSPQGCVLGCLDLSWWIHCERWGLAGGSQPLRSEPRPHFSVFALCLLSRWDMKDGES